MYGYKECIDLSYILHWRGDHLDVLKKRAPELYGVSGGLWLRLGLVDFFHVCKRLCKHGEWIELQFDSAYTSFVRGIKSAPADGTSRQYPLRTETHGACKTGKREKDTKEAWKSATCRDMHWISFDQSCMSEVLQASRGLLEYCNLQYFRQRDSWGACMLRKHGVRDDPQA